MNSLLYKNPFSVLVAVYAQNSGRVLMLQRKDDPDFWQSITGTIETGEQPKQAAIREVKEEIGVDILAQNLPLFDCHHKVNFEIFPQFRHKYAPHITHCEEHWFLLPLKEEIKPILTEHLDYRWLPASQAKALTKSWNNRAIIEKYQEHFKSSLNDGLN